MPSILPRRALRFLALSGVLTMPLMAAITPSAAAQEAPAADQPAADAVVTFADGRDSSGWLPFEMKDNVRIFIPATVNGRSVKVMLDSGASATVLDRRFVASLGLKSVGDLTAEGSGGAGQYGVVEGVVIKLGDLTITGGENVGVDLQQLEKVLHHPLPMVLGGAAFEKTVVDIDFANRRIAFRDPARFRAPQDMRSVALFPAGDNRAIDMEIEGRRARMLFDLGNAWPAVLYPRFWDNAAFLKGRSVSSTLSGGWGGMHSEGMTRLRDVRLAGATFSGVPSPLKGVRTDNERSGELDGNVGMPLFSRFRLVIDFPHQRVLFGSPADTATPFESNTSGLALEAADGGATIRHVAVASPAAGAGLKVGDVIARVQDARTGEVIPVTSRWTRGPAGRELQLTLSDGRNVVLRSAEYF